MWVKKYVLRDFSMFSMVYISYSKSSVWGSFFPFVGNKQQMGLTDSNTGQKKKKLFFYMHYSQFYHFPDARAGLMELVKMPFPKRSLDKLSNRRYVCSGLRK